MNWKIQCACVVIAGWCGVARAYEAPTNVPLKQVFIMESEGRNAGPFNSVRAALVPALRYRMIEEMPGECTLMNLNDARYTHVSDDETLATGLKKDLVGRGCNLAIAVGDSSARKMAKIHDEVFPGAPVLMVACDPANPCTGSAPSNAVVMAQRVNPAVAIENILRVLPGTTNIVVVMGDSPLEQKLVAEYHQAFAAFTNRVGFQWLNKIRFERVKGICSNLPPQTAIFFGSLISDHSNVEYDYNFALHQLSAVANAPVFALYESQFGEGVVGGPLMPDRTIGAKAADVAFRMLRGEKPESLVTPVFEIGTPVYDGRELERWEIDERNLPPGSRVLFRPPTFWQRNRTEIIAALSIMAIQSLLIVALLTNSRRLRRSEAELRERQQQAGIAERAAKMGFWVLEISNNAVWASKNCRRIFGFSEDESLTIRSFNEAVHPDDRAMRQRAVDEALRSGGEYDVEFRIVMDDGNVRWIESRGLAVANRKGKMTRVCGVALDITERKRAEEISRNEHDLMAAIFNSVPGLLYLYTEDGRLIRWNKQHEVLTGYTAEELLNFPIQNWFATEDQTKLAKEFSKVLSEGSTLVEMDLKLKNGEMAPFSFTGTKVLIDGKSCLVGIGTDISERKRAEEIIRREHDLMAAVFNSVPGLLYLYTEDGRLIRWNKQHEVMTGFTAEELINRRARDWYDEEDLITFDKAILKIFSEGYADAEMKLIHKNGERVPYFLTGSKLMFNGKPHLVGIAINISERKKAEEALRENETRLRSVLESTADGLLGVASNGRVIIQNSRFAEMWHIPQGLQAGGDDNALLAHVLGQLADPDAFLAGVRALYSSDTESMDEIYFKDGRIFERFSRPLLLSGINAGRVWSFRDVTERKRAEAMVRQLSHAMEYSPVSVVMTDLEGNMVYVNRKFRELTGYSIAESIGKNPRILKSGETSPAAYQELWARITSGGTWQGEFRNRKKNGELYWASAAISPLLDATGRTTHFLGMEEDITERRRSAQELAQQRDELAHLTRVNTLGELAASLAHELNQPLAAILSNAQAARRFLAAPETDMTEIRDILDDIVKDDKRAGEVIHRLRALVEKKSARPQRVDLNDLVRDAERLLHSELISRNVELILHVSPSLPPVMADPVEIQQVLINLVVNAMDALGDQPAGRRRIEIHTSVADKTVRVAVRDSGPGISGDVMPHIFRPFFTTKQKGLGMGLAISSTIIESCGGRMWAENHPTGGALFQFELHAA